LRDSEVRVGVALCPTYSLNWRSWNSCALVVLEEQGSYSIIWVTHSDTNTLGDNLFSSNFVRLEKGVLADNLKLR